MRPRVPATAGAVVVLVCASVHAEPGPTAAAPLPLVTDDQLAEFAASPSPSEIIELEGAAPVRPTTATERVVGEATLATTPRHTADDLLRAVPGLYLSNHGGEGKARQFFLRGFDAVHGSDLAVAVAGIGVNEPSNVHGHGYVDLGFVIPEVVGELRAREGSFALDQGDFATAGSVALELATSARGARVGYEVGTTNRHRVVGVLAPDDGPREQLVAVEAMRDAGFGANRGAERISAVAQTRLDLGGGGWVQPVALGYAARFGSPGVLPLADYRAGRAAFDDAYARGDGRSRRVLVGVRAGSGRLTGGLWLGWRDLTLDENFTGWLLYPDAGDRRVQTHASTAAGATIEWRRAVHRRIDLVAGAELRGERLRQAEDQVTEAGVAWQANRALRARTGQAAVRAGLEATWGAWRAAAGARVDAFAVDGRDLLGGLDGDGVEATMSPRATVAWERGGLGVYAGYGRGLRSPEARAFVRKPDDGADQDHRRYAGGEAAITTSDAVELGARATLGPLALTAAGFATLIDREALFDHVSGTNVERDGTRRLGVVLAAAWRPRAWLELRGDLTAVDARFDVTGNPVPGAPRLLAQAEVHLARGPWTAGVHALVIGARPLAHGATGATTAVVDALAGWRGRRAEVGLAVDNVLGRRWYEGEYHFASWWDRDRPRSSLPAIHYSAGRPLGARLTVTLHF